MGIRLRKFNDNMAVRSLAFILCIILFVATITASLSIIIGMKKAERILTLEEIFETNNYFDSSEFQREFAQQSDKLLSLISSYKSEENIKEGNLLNENNIKEGNLLDENNGELYDAILALYYDGRYYYGEQEIIAEQLQITYDVIQQEDNKILLMIINGVQYPIEFNYSPDLEAMTLDEAKAYAYEYVVYESNIENNLNIRKCFIETNKTQIERIKQILIKNQLRKFNELQGELDAQDGMIYFVTDGINSFTNINLPGTTEGTPVDVDTKEFKKNQAYMIYRDGSLIKVPESTGSSASWIRDIDQSIENSLFTQYNDDLKLYLAYNKDYMNQKQVAYKETSGILKLVPFTLGSAAGCILVFLYLIVTTGRKDQEGKRRLYALDKIWTEVQIAGICAAAIIGGLLGVEASYSWPYYSNMAYLEIWIVVLICAILASIGLWFVLSTIRLLKSRSFIKNALIYKLWMRIVAKLCGKVWSCIKEIYNGSSLMKKIVIVALAVCLLSATIFLAPIVFLIIIVFAPKWVKKFEAIQTGVDEVKNGNLTYKIEVEGDGEFDELARGINEISEASSLAIQNELKNQRLKTELISNVSHDLKTPLTSMVTYIDLLKKEGLNSENASEYLRVLDEKTNRLRQLTEDLFEAAKASSGAMPVRLEKVELLSLIHQGLGEMDQKIQSSGLEFIIKAEKDKYYVMADGQLLWRVVENLLGNVIKYAAENGRVYIDIKEQESCITLEMKNISKQPLNISSDELMERFKRGDEARTTEGSGLGLAIAKDLVKLQNGWFEIIIDGDLFKARVMLNKPQ